MAEKKKTSFDELTPKMQELVREELRRQERRRKTIIIVLVMIMVLAFGGYAVYYMTAGKTQDGYDTLARLKGSKALSNMKEGEGVVTATFSDGQEITLEILDEYKTLYNKSKKKLIGWLKIDDTIIDYPVMQGSDNEFFLSHDLEGNEDRAGALFLDCACDVVHGSDNYIIYGHHLTSGRMFSSLEEYESEKYYEKHPYINFDTIYEKGRYQVMYAFRSRVYDSDEIVFKYYQFINAESGEEFDYNMEQMAALAFYDTGVKAQWGDRLLTLSTCDYQETNGRFVVVAKKIG
ncbi:MAG: class B sortase [Lachnospiraceae bacterium]|nr:class B sortase [Lachnospiraceae bacterium]